MTDEQLQWVLHELREANKLLRILIAKQDPRIISAIAESEAKAREWDLESPSIEEIHAKMPPKEKFSDFLKRMRQDD